MTNKRKLDIPSTTKRPVDPTMEELGLQSTTPTPAAPDKAEEQATRPRMTAYVSTDVQEAARAAVWWTRNEAEGYENLSDLIEDALAEKIQKLTDQYHGGRPFPPIPEGKRLRRGRPIGR